MQYPIEEDLTEEVEVDEEIDLYDLSPEVLNEDEIVTTIYIPMVGR
ncbi:MAG: hypothetical protein R2932_57090 [Caldilineaceae bacterium]